MESWKNDFFKGKKCIKNHSLKDALGYLHKSLKDCPIENHIDLADIFFNLGVAFKKLGCIIPAIKSWDAAVCADRKGEAAKVLDRIFPGNRLDNDKSYFFLIQLSIYLGKKNSGKIESDAEKDMILDLISIYWEQVLDSGILYSQSKAEKMIIFRDIEIGFPYADMNFDLSDSKNDTSGHIIPFKTGKKSS